APNAGGIFLQSMAGPLFLSNCTLSGNQVEFNGAAIVCDHGDLRIENSTIAFNFSTSSLGGGIMAGSQSNLRLESTIVALNRATQYPDLLVTGTTMSAANCLIGDTTGVSYTDNGGNIIGVDPLLAPLANNGGPTQTHALKKGSPAIDRGSN